MADADDLLTEIFDTWASRWSVIWSFREVALAGLPYAARVISLSNAAFAEKLVSDPEYKEIFLDRAEVKNQRYHVRIAEQLTQNALQNARASVDAACLVFAHSILDDMALECLRVVSVAAPADWESDLGSKKISLADTKTKNYADMLQAIVAEALEQLSRESLLVKVDRLYRFCRPPAGWVSMRDYVFDRDRLVCLDRLRQDIVHGDAIGKAVPDAEAELNFLNKTGMHFIGLVNNFIGLVNKRYAVRLNPGYIFRKKVGGGQGQPPDVPAPNPIEERFS